VAAEPPREAMLRCLSLSLKPRAEGCAHEKAKGRVVSHGCTNRNGDRKPAGSLGPERSVRAERR
jgi:hypothetical protein